MRVVAGSRGGRKLIAPAGAKTRPTSDRVREAVFNVLASMDVLDGARVLDLFAGSGALGIEALSRGAAHCTFVDRGDPALAAIRANLAATDLADRATVVRAAAERFLDERDPTAAPFDLALVDPPYAYAGWDRLLDRLPARLAVLESDHELAVPAPWVPVRIKRYGSTVVVTAVHELPTDQPTGEAG